MWVLTLTSPFNSAKDSSPWDGAVHIQNRSSQLKPSGSIATDMPDGVEDSASSQVGNGHKPS